MDRTDPYRNHRFLIEIDGVVQAGFSECSGFGSNVEVVEYREGGDLRRVHKLRGAVSYPEISLKWGTTDSRDLYDWHLAAVVGTVERKNGSIVLFREDGQEAVRWNFFNAWPSQYEAPSLEAQSSSVAIDSLTVCCERFERD